MTFNLNNLWYGVRKYKGEFVKKYHGNTTNDNVTVTSLNISQNDGTIRIFEDFEKLSYFLNQKDDIQS